MVVSLLVGTLRLTLASIANTIQAKIRLANTNYIINSNMGGWQCGQFWSYAADYWYDTGVAQCRRKEATAVCLELFSIGADYKAQQQNVHQENSGVNLFTLNAFGQEHEVSHLGFFLGLIIIILVIVAAYFLRKRFREMAKALKEPWRTSAFARRFTPWARHADQYAPARDPHDESTSHVVRFDPGQLHQIQGLLAPIRNREFQEVRPELGVSRASARLPREESQVLAQDELRTRSTTINQI